MSRSRSSPDEPAMGPAPGVGTRDPLERIAFLLAPTEGAWTYERADDRWTLPERDADRTVVWGRAALPSGSRRFEAARSAAARERAIATARRWSSARVHRIPPQRLGGGRRRNALRSMLLGGAVVELPGAVSRHRVLDVAATAAGIRDPLDDMHLSSGGAIVARVRRDGVDAV
ncbi:MAG: hypothetical protein ACRDJ1_05470, partial [Actinomycetota bacterium]